MAEWRQLMKKVGKIKTDIYWNKKYYYSKEVQRQVGISFEKYFIKSLIYIGQ